MAPSVNTRTFQLKLVFATGLIGMRGQLRASRCLFSPRSLSIPGHVLEEFPLAFCSRVTAFINASIVSTGSRSRSFLQSETRRSFDHCHCREPVVSEFISGGMAYYQVESSTFVVIWLFDETAALKNLYHPGLLLEEGPVIGPGASR